MNKEILDVLKSILKEGYEAYIVGGYVRDFLLGKKSNDVDIITNALPKEILNIFPNSKQNGNYGSLNMKSNFFNYDITTYRKELFYDHRRPVEFVYIENLLEDLPRRDFTINAICMNERKKIIDPLNGCADIKERVIRMIGDVHQKLCDDPLRILRAIRFATVLDFRLEERLKQEILENNCLILTLPYERILKELEYIFLSDCVLKGLKLLHECGIFKLLDIYVETIVPVRDISGIWAQLEYKRDFPFSKLQKNRIKAIKSILAYGKIDMKILYKYDYYVTLIAAEILHVSKKEVALLKKKMPIEKQKDLKITSMEILEVLNISPRELHHVYDFLVLAILDGLVENQKEKLKRYLRNEWVHNEY